MNANPLILIGLTVAAYFSIAAKAVSAATVTFDKPVIQGQTAFSFDGDGDGINDVTFSTSFERGFRTANLGINQSFISGSSLEGSAFLNPDLRVDFLNGAMNNVSFGYMLSSRNFVGPEAFAAFKLFDVSGHLLSSVTSLAEVTSLPGGANSDFPEGRIVANFSGVAAYGLFDFGQTGPLALIDNFSGTFGSTESITPIPTPALLPGIIGMSLSVLRKRKQKAALKS